MAASKSITLDTPVVLGGGTRVWVRTIEFGRPDDLDQMRRATCDIDFSDVYGAIHRPSWGRD